MFKTKRFPNKKAFTIVELVVVIAVIAILMGIMFIGGTAISNNAKQSTMDSDMRNFEIAMKSMVDDSAYESLLIPSNVSGSKLDTVAHVNSDVKAALNKYFEDDMKIADFADDDAGAKATKKSYEAESSMKDPYGMPYHIVLMDDSSTLHTDISLIVYSYGQNKQTADGAETSKWDKDDVVRVIRVVDSVIYTYDLGAGTNSLWNTADETYQSWSNRAFVTDGTAPYSPLNINSGV